MEIANLSILFNRFNLSSTAASAKDAPSEDGQNTRVEHLVSYVVSNYKLVSCFDDLKPFLEQLSFGEIKILLERLGSEGSKASQSVLGI